MKTHLSFCAVLLAVFPPFAFPQQQSHMRRATEQSGGFMQGGMHHQIAAGVVLDQKLTPPPTPLRFASAR